LSKDLQRPQGLVIQRMKIWMRAARTAKESLFVSYHNFSKFLIETESDESEDDEEEKANN
jgi:hypothetical protein